MDPAPADAASGASVAFPAREIPDEPPRELRFRRNVRMIPAIRELWQDRPLIRALAERELRARYKQAWLGATWAVIIPFTYMVAFTIFFKRVVDVRTYNVPYPILSYVGLIPWTFFSNSMSSAALSLTSNLSLLNKVYCPREVFPVATIGVAAVDTVISTSVLFVLFAVYTYMPHLETIWAIPALIAVQLAFMVGLALILSVATVYMRDLRHGLPILLQIGLFVTPVAYGIEVVPREWRWLYSLVNPLAPVIDGYRRILFKGEMPQWEYLAFGALTATVVLVGGYRLFKRLETGIADVA